MIKAKALRPGDTIGLTGPSGAVRTENGVERAINYLKGLGFRVKVGQSCGQVYGYLSGTDRVRAQDVNRMFADDAVDAVFCLKGGYGTPRILDALDYDVVRKHPKLFLGYSDITTMHIAYNQQCELITLHGPMPASDMIFESHTAFTAQHFWQAITTTRPLGQLKNPDDMALSCLSPGRAAGILCGGNLTLIATSLGTPWEIDTRGKILFIEEIGERTYRVDNLLTQLRLAGKLADCAGVILGDFTDCPVEYPDFGLTLTQIFDDLLPKDKPVIAGLAAGHGPNKLTLPLGAMCELDAGAPSIAITESALV